MASIESDKEVFLAFINKESTPHQNGQDIATYEAETIDSDNGNDIPNTMHIIKDQGRPYIFRHGRVTKLGHKHDADEEVVAEGRKAQRAQEGYIPPHTFRAPMVEDFSLNGESHGIEGEYHRENLVKRVLERHLESLMFPARPYRVRGMKQTR